MGINLAVLAVAQEPSLVFVCVLGIAVVFVGLICIIGIVMLMNMICNGFGGRKDPEPDAVSTPAVYTAPLSATPVAAPIENRQEIIAAVCAAIAEENGTDISAIRVISFKRL